MTIALILWFNSMQASCSVHLWPQGGTIQLSSSARKQKARGEAALTEHRENEPCRASLLSWPASGLGSVWAQVLVPIMDFLWVRYYFFFFLLNRVLQHVCRPYLRILKARRGVIVCAKIFGRPDDWTGGNWVWLKEGKPGV